VKIGPMHETGPFAANDETLPMAEYAIRELSGYGLSHLLIVGNTTDFTGTPLEPPMGDGMFRHFAWPSIQVGSTHPVYSSGALADGEPSRTKNCTNISRA
jgi:hypothetical protein